MQRQRSRFDNRPRKSSALSLIWAVPQDFRGAPNKSWLPWPRGLSCSGGVPVGRRGACPERAVERAKP